MTQRAAKLVLAGFIALVFAVPMANADHSMKGYGKGCGEHQERGMKKDFESKFFHKTYLILGSADELGLSKKQEEDIQSLALEVKKNMIKQGAEIEILGEDIAHQMRGDSINVESVNQLVDQKYELKKAKTKSLVEAIAKLKQNLSEDQRAKLKDLYKGKSHSKKV